MCGYCCGSTPPEKRGDAHQGCSAECYNAPNAPNTARARLLRRRNAQVAAVEALAAEWEQITGDNSAAVDQWHDAAEWLRRTLAGPVTTPAPDA